MTRVTQRAMPPRANRFGVIAMYPAAATLREILSLSGLYPMASWTSTTAGNGPRPSGMFSSASIGPSGALMVMVPTRSI